LEKTLKITGTVVMAVVRCTKEQFVDIWEMGDIDVQNVIIG